MVFVEREIDSKVKSRIIGNFEGVTSQKLIIKNNSSEYADRKDSPLLSGLQVCDECGADAILDRTRGEWICHQCGLVLGREYVQQQYHISGEQFVGTTRDYQAVSPGARSALIDGLGTYITSPKSWRLCDKDGKDLPPKRREQFKRLIKHNLRSRRDKNETLNQTLKTMDRVCKILHFSMSQIEACAHLLRKIRKNLEDGDFYNHLNLAAIAIWHIAKTQMPGVYRINDICAPFIELNCRVSVNSVLETYYAVYSKCKHFLEKVQPTSSEVFLPRIVGSIISYKPIKDRLDEKQIRPSEYESALNLHGANLLKRISKEERGARRPKTFAAAIVYAADYVFCHLQKIRSILTHKLISDAARTTESSEREHWGDIIKDHAIQYLNELTEYRMRPAPTSSTLYRTLKIMCEACKSLGFSEWQTEKCSTLLKKIHKEVKRGDFFNHLNLAPISIRIFTKAYMPGVFRIYDVCAPFIKLNYRISVKSVLKTYNIIYPKCKHFLEKARLTTSEDFLPSIAVKIISYKSIKVRLDENQINPSEYRAALNQYGAALLKRISKEERGARDPYLFAGAVIYGANYIFCHLRQVRHLLTHPLLHEIMKGSDSGRSACREHWRDISHHAINYLRERK